MQLLFISLFALLFVFNLASTCSAFLPNSRYNAVCHRSLRNRFAESCGKTALGMAKKQGPGFSIKNDTKFPVQISLGQVGPLYWGVVQPGGTFTRNTGAVWFTVKASIVLDGKETISVWDAITPVAAIVGSVALAAVSAGTLAGPAAATMTGSAAVAGTTGAVASATAVANTAIASTLVGAGMTAGTALTVASATVGGTIAATTAVTSATMKDVFKEENMSTSKAGVYAGPPWKTKRKLMHVSGGPTITSFVNEKGEKESVLEGHTIKLQT